MKRVVHVDHARLARIRKQILEDEIAGYDPGARWKRYYPDATEIEFVVDQPEQQTVGGES